MLKTIANGKVAVRLRFGVRPAEDRPGTANRVDGRALAAAAVTVVLWASAFVSIRSSAGHFGPGALALGRLLVGAVVLGALLLARREGLPPREAWRGIAGSGILWFGAYMVALNGGEHEVDAGTASMVVNVGPILIALLSGWLLKEGFPPRLLLADDDPEDRMLTRDSLVESRCANRLDTVEDGEELMDYLSRRGKFAHLEIGR